MLPRKLTKTTRSNPVFIRLSSKLQLFSSNLKIGSEDIIANNKPLTWYSCGPTVYDLSHIGHARSYICQDIMRRIMQEFLNIDIVYTMGITDIDDKIIDSVNASNTFRTTKELTDKFEKSFFEDMDALNVKRPDAVLRVTDHVDDIIKYIQTILDNGFGYVTPSGVYFNVIKLGTSYGKLGPIPPMTRNEQEISDKRDPRDFALWKAAKPNEPYWDSPWGRGRPGWHIECSAMTHAFFGSELDIHSGGIDLKFPHHTNEIAQCESHNGIDKSWVKHWIHTGHLYIAGSKMSKSLKNFISIQQYLTNQWTAAPAQDLRIYFLHHKYSSSLHFSVDRIKEAAAYRERIETLYQYTDSLFQQQQQQQNQNQHQQHSIHYRSTPHSSELLQYLSNTRKIVLSQLSNDFDTPSAMIEISHLIGKAIQYALQLKKGVEGPIEPLLAVKQYVIHMMGIFGVKIDYLLQSDNSTLSSSISVDSTSTTSKEIAAKSLIEFRSRVRSSGLRGLKLLSKYQKSNKVSSTSVEVLGEAGNDTKEGLSMDNINKTINTTILTNNKDTLSHQRQDNNNSNDQKVIMLQSIKESIQEVLEACDWARDIALPAIGYKIEDTAAVTTISIEDSTPPPPPLVPPYTKPSR